MLMLIDFIPACCSLCGASLKFDEWDISDLNSGCCHSCVKCGLKYIKLDTNLLRNTAEKAGSDLKLYVQGT